MASQDQRERVMQWATLALSLFGLGVSAYLTIAHYSTRVTLVCPASGGINCQQVTTSAESMLFGVFPVAVLGLAFFVFMAGITSPWAWRSQLQAVRLARLGAVIVGMGFVVYLIYAELFSIGAICLWCTGVHIATFLLFGLVVSDASFTWNRTVGRGRRAAAARQRESRRRALLAGGSVLTVIAVILALIVAKTAGGTSPSVGPAGSAATRAHVIRTVTSIPASEFNVVGAGPAGTVTPLQPATQKAPLLTSGGKPEMLYMGAEWCPYCAAERWAMAAALSRFGGFTGLRLIRSAGNDIYSNTATLSFYRSAYTSKYLVFTAVEAQTVDKTPLQIPTAAQLAVMKAYNSSGAFPFVDVGNMYIGVGSQFLPSLLGTTQNMEPSHFGLTWAQIAAALKNPSDPIAQAILGSANHITAAICAMTHGQPGSVCTSPAVTSIKQI
jgi:uncharacterized membrane protein/thiol-disulfide isomerase/thioredoxin